MLLVILQEILAGLHVLRELQRFDMSENFKEIRIEEIRSDLWWRPRLLRILVELPDVLL